MPVVAGRHSVSNPWAIRLRRILRLVVERRDSSAALLSLVGAALWGIAEALLSPARTLGSMRGVFGPASVILRSSFGPAPHPRVAMGTRWHPSGPDLAPAVTHAAAVKRASSSVACRAAPGFGRERAGFPPVLGRTLPPVVRAWTAVADGSGDG